MAAMNDDSDICKEDDIDKLNLHEECLHRLRSSIMAEYVERYHQSLARVDQEGCLPLHRLLNNPSSTMEDALMMIEKYPAALQHQNNREILPFHVECFRQWRSPIISKCIELYPESLEVSDKKGCLPLTILLWNAHAVIEDALMMIEKYPAALTRYHIGYLPIHYECIDMHRSDIISKCIESLSMKDKERCLPLHRILVQDSSTVIDLALLMMERYPAALKCQNEHGDLPIMIECKYKCRASILLKCIELYPEGLEVADSEGILPLHYLVWNEESSNIEAVMDTMEKYPAALEHRNNDDEHPLHLECRTQCRSPIISKYIELYPESLTMTDDSGYLPLHLLVCNQSSSIEDALTIIEKYPAALKCLGSDELPPLHLECINQCRSPIILKCMELYPDALDYEVIHYVMEKIDKNNFHEYISVFTVIFTALPMSLSDWCDGHGDVLLLYSLRGDESDIRADPDCRRRILHLLPHHVFTPVHDADYQDLNWKPRAAMMILLSLIHQPSSNAVAMLLESSLAQRSVGHPC
jgi:hypothetical protein